MSEVGPLAVPAAARTGRARRGRRRVVAGRAGATAAATGDPDDPSHQASAPAPAPATPAPPSRQWACRGSRARGLLRPQGNVRECVDVG